MIIAELERAATRLQWLNRHSARSREAFGYLAISDQAAFSIGRARAGPLVFILDRPTEAEVPPSSKLSERGCEFR